MSSSSSLTNCCICLEKMKQPIKTLPCLHSSCSTCIDQLMKMGKKPFKCPLCRSPFDVARLDPNYFTSHLLASSASSSAGGQDDDFDPNNIICEGCEENEAQEYCKDCPMFFCLGCKKTHLKPKVSAHHQVVSLDEGLKIKSGVSSSSSFTRTTHCHKHHHLEVNSYCEKCKEACCAECSVDSHSEHKVVRLATISQQFKGDISALMNKVKKYDSDLSQAIKETTDTLVGLKKQPKLTEEHVHQVFDKLRLLLDEREAELIGDIEKEKHQKEKELLIQKDDLEFLLKGIRDSVEFSERLVTEGSEVEIAASHKPVIGRFGTLETEMKKTPLLPVTDEVIEFLGGESGVDESKKIIRGLGAIVVRGIISAEKSSIVRNSGNLFLNQKYSFDVILVDQKGNKVTRVPHAGIQVKIDGPSKDVKVDIVEKPGEEGKLTVSFILNQVGDHEISVIFKGKHLQGSPFKLKVVEKPIYRREYGLVGDQPVVRFGSQGNGDGQFLHPYGVACNLKGEIIVVDTYNHRIQVFDKDGKFLFKFGSNGNGNGQFNYPFGVAVDHRNNNQIVVADGENHRIQIFDEKGGFLRSFGSLGNDDGQFSNPRGVTVDQTNGNYFVVDYSIHRVQVFDSNGRFIRKFGSYGNGNGQFSNPLGIGLLSNGNIVVSEWNGKRLQIFDSTGNFIRVIPGLNNPARLFVDSDDNILVSDYNENLIHVFKENGNHVKTIGKGQLSGPTGICMDHQGRILVSEYGGQRISIF